MYLRRNLVEKPPDEQNIDVESGKDGEGEEEEENKGDSCALVRAQPQTQLISNCFRLLNMVRMWDKKTS